MKSKLLPLPAAALAASVAGSVYADSGSAPASIPRIEGNVVKKTVTAFKCEDFLALVDTFKPQAVAWAEGFAKGHKNPSETVIDVQGANHITPGVIEDCKKSLKETFWEKVKKAM